jgi:hypothetical protein
MAVMNTREVIKVACKHETRAGTDRQCANCPWLGRTVIAVIGTDGTPPVITLNEIPPSCGQGSCAHQRNPIDHR